MPYYFAPITIQAFKKLPLYFKEHINQIYSYFTINGVTAKDLHGGCELEALPDDEVIQLAYLKVGQQEHSKKKMVNETEALFHVFIESVETLKDNEYIHFGFTDKTPLFSDKPFFKRAHVNPNEIFLIEKDKSVKYDDNIEVVVDGRGIGFDTVVKVILYWDIIGKDTLLETFKELFTHFKWSKLSKNKTNCYKNVVFKDGYINEQQERVSHTKKCHTEEKKKKPVTAKKTK